MCIRDRTVALVHQNSQALDVQAQMEELAMEIELLDYAMNQTDDVVSVARLDESILQSLASLRFASASGSYRQLDDDVMELKSQVLKRSYTYGEGLDSSQLSALRQSLIEEYRALRTQSSSVTSRITCLLYTSPLLLQRLLDQLRLVAGIDDGGQVRLVVLQNIAVGADGPHPQQLYFHR